MVLSMGTRYGAGEKTLQAYKTVTVAEEVLPEKISLAGVRMFN